MRVWLVAGALYTCLPACSSSSEDGAGPNGGCSDIAGNWETTRTRTSGTCDPALDGDGKGTFTLSKDGAGWILVLPGVQGTCPGTLDAACKFTTTCELKGKDGALVATASVDYAFSGDSFTGSVVNGLRPPAVTTACSANYRVTGKKL